MPKEVKFESVRKQVRECILSKLPELVGKETIDIFSIATIDNFSVLYDELKCKQFIENNGVFEVIKYTSNNYTLSASDMLNYVTFTTLFIDSVLCDVVDDCQPLYDALRITDSVFTSELIEAIKTDLQ